MKIQKNSSVLITMGIIGLVAFSSCNRGYGCPYDFSITDGVSNLLAFCIKTMISLF